MGVGDITGVLSRYFLLGYWVPSFATLFALAWWVSEDRLPAEYTGLGWETKLLVLGALALLIGLVLIGLRYPITRILEGYWPGPVRRVAGPLVKLQTASYDRLRRVRDDEQASSGARSTAARLLDRRFHRDRDNLLPTRFGNAYRAFENYSYTRYGLDGIAIWPRVDPLLSDQERELHTNAASDLAFFVNGVLGAAIAGVVFLVDQSLPWWAYPIPFALAYVLYRASVGAVERVGTERRASIDLHRLELYERLGVRRPESLEEERTTIARAVNRFLLWGEAIPATLLRKEGA